MNRVYKHITNSSLSMMQMTNNSYISYSLRLREEIVREIIKIEITFRRLVLFDREEVFLFSRFNYRL